MSDAGRSRGADGEVPLVRLGTLGLEVSALGLGCMVMTRSYASTDVGESRATLERALELGVVFLDTADAYADGDNERFLGEALEGRRHGVVLASKFGLVRDPDRPSGVDGRPDHVRASCEASLRRLRTDHLDLYYQHRVDPDVPVEESVGAMAELVGQGKVRFLGLSEPLADELRRAHAVHPLSAVQSEWSLWARGIETEVVPAARALGIGIVPYAPLGRGFLAGAITRPGVLEPGDLRAGDPRLGPDHIDHNLRLVAVLQELAARRSATAAQVALAWLRARGPDVVPIPGVERRDLLEENLATLDIELGPAELDELDVVFPPGAAHGNPDAVLQRVRPG